MVHNNIFPEGNNKDVKKQNIQIQTYGQRLYRDQTFYEYILEFLLIFISNKGSETSKTKDNGFSFPIHLKDEKLAYYPYPRMGLKRFVFLSRSEPDKRFNVDINALEDHRDYLKSKINISDSNISKEFVLDILQDLFYGFNAIIGKRSWFAQSLLPVTPELIFPEAIGSKKFRENLDYQVENDDVDFGFEFNQRSFMARGGEVYYLHVLQGLVGQNELKNELEELLRKLIKGVPQLSILSNFIQVAWQEYHYPNQPDKIQYITKTMEWIPSNYRFRSFYTVSELRNLLSSLIDPLEKIDLLGTLIIFQIMRMMSLQASLKLENEDNMEWVIDLTNDPNGQIRKIATTSYQRFEENVFRAVHTADINTYKEVAKREEADIYEDASKDTNRLIRKLGKDIDFIIPPKGANMRFSLNEDLIKLLVIIIIKPGERMLLNTFLEKCYEQFKIIIGPKEAKLHWKDKIDFDFSPFDNNSEKFQEMLKDSGFLRDLSDAISIVENPFKG
ncbi:hypothetical protein HHO41_18675 [Bacillus sp. DNRA2]|uniref:hypothetical protein n=1 Tax=Bacillus sp. DNRA2 TaxID=2723053 RepID=UPI00145D4290|nr:hypothetical protein [Bacillus sp. DNRA2]NMD72297.1 hypothetical protein [Bacillus sp. DNRA2]